MSGRHEPDARSHLPRRIERRLLRRYATSAFGRIGSTAVLRALSVLVRRHPRAALDAASAGFAQAARTTFHEIKQAVVPTKKPKPVDLPPALVARVRHEVSEKLDDDEAAAIRKMIDRDGSSS